MSSCYKLDTVSETLIYLPSLDFHKSCWRSPCYVCFINRQTGTQGNYMISSGLSRNGMDLGFKEVEQWTPGFKRLQTGRLGTSKRHFPSSGLWERWSASLTQGQPLQLCRGFFLLLTLLGLSLSSILSPFYTFSLSCCLEDPQQEGSAAGKGWVMKTKPEPLQVILPSLFHCPLLNWELFSTVCIYSLPSSLWTYLPLLQKTSLFLLSISLSQSPSTCFCFVLF